MQLSAVQISASYESQNEVVEQITRAALWSFCLVLICLFFQLLLKNHFLRCILYVTAC